MDIRETLVRRTHSIAIEVLEMGASAGQAVLEDQAGTEDREGLAEPLR
jgi:hypothetical protein